VNKISTTVVSVEGTIESVVTTTVRIMEACALAMKAGVEAAVMVTLMVALFAMATEVRAVAGGASLISVPVRAGACQDTVATSAMLRLTCATFAMVIVARAAATWECVL